MSIFQKIVLYISIATLPAFHAYANQDQNLFDEGLRLYQQKQFLLSACQFLTLKNIGSTDYAKSLGMWGYTLDVKELGEQQEFYEALNIGIQQAIEPIRFKFKLLKALQFVGDSSDLDPKDQLRVSLWSARKHTASFQKLLQEQPQSDTKSLRDLQLESVDVHKSPRTAAMLSIIPGGGQLYVGSVRSAIVSMVINGVFGYATYELIKKHFYGTAAAAGFVFSITYTGNIFNSARSADRINRQLQKPSEEKLYQALFPELIQSSTQPAR